MSKQGENNVDHDGLLMDWLYGELSTEDEARFEREIAADPERMAEANALARTREAVSELPEAEPPASLSAVLMQEAAKHAKPATKDKSPGIFAWLGQFFQQMAAHPGLAAAASLVLIAGVAGTLYVTGQVDEASQAEVAVRGDEPSTALSTAAKSEVELPAATPTPTGSDGIAEGVEAEPPPPSEDRARDFLQVVENKPSLEEEADDDGFADTKSNEYAVRLGREEARSTAARERDLRAEKSRGARLADLDTNKELKKKSRRKSVARQDKAPQGVIGGVSKPTSNAISGYAPGDGEAAGGDYRYSGGRNIVTKGGPAPVGANEGKAQKQDTSKLAQAPQRPSPAVRRWAVKQRSRIPAAAKKDCRVAARIANDILDKDPSYYNQSVRGAKDLAKCRWYVSNETNLRSRRRAAARANSKSGTKAGGGSSATAAPRKRKAAPRPATEQAADEFAE